MNGDFNLFQIKNVDYNSNIYSQWRLTNKLIWATVYFILTDIISNFGGTHIVYLPFPMLKYHGLLLWSRNLLDMVWFCEFYFIVFIICVFILGLILPFILDTKISFIFLLSFIVFGMLVEIFFLVLLYNSLIDSIYFCNNQFYIAKYIVLVKIFICFISIIVFLSVYEYYKYNYSCIWRFLF